MKDDINQEDIATALRGAGSDRYRIDRQDYATVLKQLGDGHEYIDDQDLSEFILGHTGGDNAMAMLHKPFPNLAGFNSDIPIFNFTGPVGFSIIVYITQTLVVTGTVALQCGYTAVPDNWIYGNIGVGTHLAGKFWYGTVLNNPSFSYHQAETSGMFVDQTFGVRLRKFGAGSITAGGIVIAAKWHPVVEGAEMLVV